MYLSFEVDRSCSNIFDLRRRFDFVFFLLLFLDFDRDTWRCSRRPVCYACLWSPPHRLCESCLNLSDLLLDTPRFYYRLLLWVSYLVSTYLLLDGYLVFVDSYSLFCPFLELLFSKVGFF
jgi:hypothetical protein